jgi:lysozyme
MRPYLFICLLFLLVSCDQSTVQRNDFTVQGIDISHYQRVTDWQALKKQGVRFVIHKATEGKDHTDTTFATRWPKLKEHGFVRGAYHFFSPTSPGIRQASHFIDQVTLEQGDLPPVLDFEVVGKLNREQVLSELRTWLNTVELSCGSKPIIYTNFKLYNKYIAGNFPDNPVWLAQYNNSEPRLAGINWMFWQYGNRGKLKGIQGEVDFNVFNSDYYSIDSICLKPQVKVPSS